MGKVKGEAAGAAPNTGVVAQPEQVPPQPPDDVAQGAPKNVPVPVPTPAGQGEQKRKPGRPPGSGSKPKPAASSQVNAEEVETFIITMLVMVFDVLAARLGEEWKIDPGTGDYPEARKVAVPAARIVDRLGGSAVAKYGDWVALAGALAMLIAPRVYIYLQKQPKKKEGKPAVRPPAQTPEVPAAGSGSVMDSVTSVVGGIAGD